MKMTFQPKKRQRSKVHGFRARMSSAGGRKVLAARRAKRKKEIIRIGRSFVAYFLYGDNFMRFTQSLRKNRQFQEVYKKAFPRQQVFGHVCIGESSG